MIAGVGVDVRDVEQQQRVGAFDDLGDELCLAHLVLGVGEERRDAFERERDVELGLDAADVSHHHVDGGARARQRRQVADLETTRPHERDVLTDERRARDGGRPDEVRDAIDVEALGVTEPELHPVRDDGDAALAQLPQGWRHAVHDGFGDHFDPRQARLGGEDVRDLGAPSDADARRHRRGRCGPCCVGRRDAHVSHDAAPTGVA